MKLIGVQLKAPIWDERHIFANNNSEIATLGPILLTNAVIAWRK